MAICTAVIRKDLGEDTGIPTEEGVYLYRENEPFTVMNFFDDDEFNVDIRDKDGAAYSVMSIDLDFN